MRKASTGAKAETDEETAGTGGSKPYDQAFKFLAEQDVEAWLQLLQARPADLVSVTPLPREVSVAALLPDQPYLVTTKRGHFILHIEAQTYYDTNLPQRMAEYGVVHWLKYRLPVISLVLLLTPQRLPQQVPESGVIEAGDTRTETHYRVVRLWEISARAMLALNRPALLPFILLMQGGEQELNLSAARLRQIKNEAQRQETALHFVRLGSLRYNRADLLTMVLEGNMIPIEQLAKTPFYKWIKKEGRKEGHEEGREEALQQELHDLREIMQALAAQRFPKIRLAPELEKISDLAALHQLILELQSLPTAAALKQRVAALSRKNGGPTQSRKKKQT